MLPSLGLSTAGMSDCGTQYGSAMDVPVWRSGGCYSSDPNRDLSTVSCSRATDSYKRRLCYCHAEVISFCALSGFQKETNPQTCPTTPSIKCFTGKGIQSPPEPQPQLHMYWFGCEYLVVCLLRKRCRVQVWHSWVRLYPTTRSSPASSSGQARTWRGRAPWCSLA